jgi:molybdopterin-guanine dinucleotide biosynthesis protein A
MMECYILAGGQSRRFGEDKTLFPLKGKPCIQWVVEQAQRVCNRVFIVAKEPQKYSFLKGIELLKDILHGQFALAGLYTALSHTNQDKVVVLSADMPLIKGELISIVWERSKDKTVKNALYSVEGVSEVDVSLQGQSAKVKVEDQVSFESLKSAVESWGYKVVDEV